MTEQKQPEAEAAGFLNPFKWGKKKDDKPESKADKAAANPPTVDSTTPSPTPAAPAAAPAAAAKTYTVKAGDTLWDIAVKYYGDGRKYTKIASANNIPNPNLINIGTVITIPD